MTLRELLEQHDVSIDDVLDARIGGPDARGGPNVSASIRVGEIIDIDVHIEVWP